MSRSSLPRFWRGTIRFDRNEWSGAFGDIGTDFPLVVGLILVARLDPASVLILFGAMQVFAGLSYGLPMPAQPLKAMAVIVLAGGVSADVLYGGGLAIGAFMLILTASGLMTGLARAIPKCAVRGIQFGLGLKLSLMALRYVQSRGPAGVEGGDGLGGYVLAAVAFVLTLCLLGNRKVPPALLVILLGVAYALIFKLDGGLFQGSVGFRLPHPHVPAWGDIWTGFLVLALTQIPLSLGNSILATEQIASDLFPGRAPSVRKIGLTYSIMNLVNPFFGGIPTCHGSGGMIGHYTFGARTGGSVILYGSLYLVLGLFLSPGFEKIVRLFPLPILGVILLFEGVGLIRLIADQIGSKQNFTIVLFVGVVSAGLPYGFLIGLVGGTVLSYVIRWNDSRAPGSTV